MKYTVPLLLAVALSAGSIAYMFHGRTLGNAAKQPSPNRNCWRLQVTSLGLGQSLPELKVACG